MSEETKYICPDCGGPLEFSHEDDVQQKWWGCTKCGELTTKPQKKVTPSATTKKPRPPAKKDQCGSCAWYMTPKCDLLDHFKKGIMTSTDEKCGDFYRKHMKGC